MRLFRGEVNMRLFATQQSDMEWRDYSVLLHSGRLRVKISQETDQRSKHSDDDEATLGNDPSLPL